MSTEMDIIAIRITLCWWWLHWPFQNDAKNLKNELNPWHVGSPLSVLNESYPMNTNMTGFIWFLKICVSFLREYQLEVIDIESDVYMIKKKIGVVTQ